MASGDLELTGNVIDVRARSIRPGRVTIRDGRIAGISNAAGPFNTYLMPGFVDAHIHIESALLPPSQFATLAVPHGTVATVSDPHEIANVLGAQGVTYMIEDGKRVPMKLSFGAPSCVPATSFETSGASLDTAAVSELLSTPDVAYLAEVMNYPGVLARAPEVMGKIEAAIRAGKPVDGHAPGLTGEDARRYVECGISTDHECVDLREALEKVALGMSILIREGSAAKNYDALAPLLSTHPAAAMFCSDDRHPDDLIAGHIDALVRRALADGYALFDVLHAASVNAVDHYKLPVGLLRQGDPADLIEVTNLDNLQVRRVFIDGQQVAENGRALFAAPKASLVNRFATRPKRAADFHVPAKGNRVRVIGVSDALLVTEELHREARIEGDRAVAAPERDLLKLAVVNRYHDAKPAVGFVEGFGLRSGAIASSVAHDSHNIVAVGATDEELAEAVNLIIEAKGGLSVVADGERDLLPLPIAGLMSDLDGKACAARYEKIQSRVRALESPLAAPFMALSFVCLLVVPQLKISDLGLFDASTQSFVPVFLPT